MECVLFAPNAGYANRLKLYVFTKNISLLNFMANNLKQQYIKNIFKKVIYLTKHKSVLKDIKARRFIVEGGIFPQDYVSLT